MKRVHFLLALLYVAMIIIMVIMITYLYGFVVGGALKRLRVDRDCDREAFSSARATHKSEEEEKHEHDDDDDDEHDGEHGDDDDDDVEDNDDDDHNFNVGLISSFAKHF